MKLYTRTCRYLADRDMAWGWGDSAGEEGADSDSSSELCTGMIFFLARWSCLRSAAVCCMAWW